MKNYVWMALLLLSAVVLFACNPTNAPSNAKETEENTSVETSEEFKNTEGNESFEETEEGKETEDTEVTEETDRNPSVSETVPDTSPEDPVTCQHTFGDWQTVETATCAKAGKRVRVCTACAETEEESIPKSETHTPVTDAAVSATCQKTGLTEGSHCSVCNTILVAQTVVAKVPHTEVTDSAMEATCTHAGKTEGKHCSVCRETLIPQTIIPAKGHTDGEWILDRQATCETEGLHHRSCTVCGTKTKEEVIPSSHSFVNGFCQCGAVKESEGLTFAAIHGGYAVTGLGSCTDEFLIIPKTYHGQPVIEISSDAFSLKSSFSKVLIPSTIQIIGKDAFIYCYTLTDVLFEENSSLITIESGAFNTCQNLQSIVLPEGLETIASGAFLGCDKLKEVTFPSTLKTIGKNAFCYSAALSKIYIKDLAAWCNISFENKYSNPAYIAKAMYTIDGEPITDLVIPEGVTRVSAFAFCNVKSITRIFFPESLESIESNAFANCNSVTEMHVADLEAWCRVSKSADKGMSARALYLNGREITHLLIPETVTAIKPYTFAGFSSLLSVTVSDSVTSIGEGAFQVCQNLTAITLPKELKEIPKRLLSNNTSLTSIEIPDTVTTIGDSAFYACSSVVSFYIPSSVTYIGEGAFDKCDGVETFIFEVKTGWKMIYTAGSVTIYSGNLETSQSTIQEIRKYNYGYWQRS
ncbi:MAG: leucine-rich repeat domain-containing protein [Ruminococcaceae bacterium]|nr:leucine-rich repeat domain-containing protein [Oscillospiraceae bacterium]